MLPATAAEARPAKWAVRVHGGAGLPNLYRITPKFYRSGQPTSQGFTQAATVLGVRTIVNLNDNPDAADISSLNLVHVRMNAFKTADDDDPQLPRALAAIQKGLASGPTLVHCQHGKDRTGGIVAVWRILYQKWPPEAAIREMNEGGYGYSGWLFSNIRHIRALDFEKLRKQVEAL